MDRTDHEYIRLLSEAFIVFALCWTGQPHNSKVRMAQKDLRCEQWGTSRISGFCLRRHAVHATPRAVFAGYDHNGRKNMWMKAPSASCARRYVQLVAMLSYIYIFWKCPIVSVNQGLRAPYRSKTGEKSSIQNSLSRNRAKLLDFLVPLLGKLK